MPIKPKLIHIHRVRHADQPYATEVRLGTCPSGHCDTLSAQNAQYACRILIRLFARTCFAACSSRLKLDHSVHPLAISSTKAALYAISPPLPLLRLAQPCTRPRSRSGGVVLNSPVRPLLVQHAVSAVAAADGLAAPELYVLVAVAAGVLYCARHVLDDPGLLGWGRL
jgi:hypothetical protein